jgi:hypothetical protein
VIDAMMMAIDLNSLGVSSRQNATASVCIRQFRIVEFGRGGAKKIRKKGVET